MKKKRIEVIRTNKFWKDREDERIQHLHLDGKDLKTTGFYIEMLDMYAFNKSVIVPDFPKIFTIRMSDIGSNLILPLTLNKRKIKSFNGVLIAKKANDLILGYSLDFELDKKNKKAILEKIQEIQNIIGEGSKNKPSFEFMISNSKKSIVLTMQKMHTNPKKTFEELIMPDVELIKGALKKVNKTSAALKSIK